jgi:CheY-like chemotaxis protein
MYCVLCTAIHTNNATQMGGKQAAAIIRQHSQHVPIIFLTGEIAASMKATAKQFEPSQLLLKPCSKKDLIAVSHLSSSLLLHVVTSSLAVVVTVQ